MGRHEVEAGEVAVLGGVVEGMGEGEGELGGGDDDGDDERGRPGMARESRAEEVDEAGERHVDEEAPLDGLEAAEDGELRGAVVGNAHEGVAVGDEGGEGGDDEERDDDAQRDAAVGVFVEAAADALPVAFLLDFGRGHS